MTQFHPPVLSDRCWAAALTASEGIPLCDYAFPVLFCWAETYGFQIARLEEGDTRRLLVRLDSSRGPAYLWPAGTGDPAPALEALTEDAHAKGHALRLICLQQYQKNWLEDQYPGRFEFADVRDSYDYLYSVDRLADLPGKKLHAKRNHIRRLDDACPGWEWHPITDADVPHCLAMSAEWYEEARLRDDPDRLSTLADEHRALVLAMENRRALGLEGVVLRHEGKVFAFALGAPLTDTVFDVHFERARSDLQGAYPAVNRSFARHVRDRYPRVRYLNREDDMGVPGLRKAKLSYYPEYLQVNFCAVEVSMDAGSSGV